MLNWIKILVDTATKRRWCVKPNCTTCGASEFRCALTMNAAQKSKIILSNIRVNTTYNNHPKKPILNDLSDENYKVCIKSISKELAQLTQKEIDEINYGSFIKPCDALRLIFMEVFMEKDNKPNCQGIVEQILYTTPAEKILNSMKEHYGGYR